MPAPFFFDLYAKNQATARQSAFAGSIVGLFKFGFTPTPATLIEELEEHECDYDDYVRKTITAWLAPVRAVSGGYQITAPTVQFVCSGPQAVPNTVGGYWIALADESGILCRTFDAGVPMVNDSDYVQVNPTVVIPIGQ